MSYPVVGSFDAGHGRNNVVKDVYVKNIVKLLEKYEAEL
jgi:1,4-dihydroxy-2-naphthoyl-CoA synthase